VTVRIGVLALQGDFREHIRMLEDCGAEATKVRTEADLERVDGLIIPGGESTTIGMLMVRNGLEDPLRTAIAAGMPVMGTCAGMILLASEVLDGRPDQVSLGAIDMTVRRNAFGRQVDSFEAAVRFRRCRARRSPRCSSGRRGSSGSGRIGEVLGTVTGDDGTDRIVAVRQGNALATSFHPEVTDDVRFHALLVDMVQEGS
jgi:5'-phosphate synthase pdxT subunit